MWYKRWWCFYRHEIIRQHLAMKTQHFQSRVGTSAQTHTLICRLLPRSLLQLGLGWIVELDQNQKIMKYNASFT